MSRNFDSVLNKYKTVKDLLAEYQPLVSKYARLDQEATVYNNLWTELQQQVDNKKLPIKGVTVGKSDSFDAMGSITLKLSLKGVVWAQDTNSQPLVAIFTISQSRYDNLTYAKRLALSKAVFSGLSSNAAALTAYNITDADLAAFAAAIAGCEDAIVAPGKATKNKKTAGTVADAIAAKMDASIETMAKLVKGEYADTEPAFVSVFLNSMKQDTVAVRHTGISASITAAATGNAIENAVLNIGGLNKTATSNLAGLAEIIKMKAGSYHTSISAVGYTTQLLDVTVIRGKVVELMVALVLA